MSASMECAKMIVGLFDPLVNMIKSESSTFYHVRIKLLFEGATMKEHERIRSWMRHSLYGFIVN